MTSHLVYGALLGGLLLTGVSPEPSLAQFNPPPLLETLRVGSPRPVRFGEAAWGDYDADGDFDLILTGSLRAFDRPDPVTQLYRNDGDTVVLVEDPADGAMVEAPATRYVDAINPTLPVLEDVWQSALAWGDYDNDGDLDLAVTGIPTGGAATLRLYENVGGADHLAPRLFEPGVQAGDAAWGDVDNDGDLDLLVCGSDAAGTPRTYLYENQIRAGGGFTRRQAGLAGLANCSVAWGDVDNDGDLDLLATGIAHPQAFVTTIYRNDGGHFTDAGAGLKGLLYASVAWGDYDADGDLDVLLSGARMTPFILEGQIKIYRNDGGAFTDVSDNLRGGFENDETRGRYQGAAAWGDVDNDGLLDFFVSGAMSPVETASLEVYHTDRNHLFTKSVAAHLARGSFDGGLFGNAFWGDYDDDNDLDLFVVGEVPGRGTTIKALRNYLSTFPSNTPPDAPAGLTATVQGNAVTLSWNPASDAQTPAPGLTYNLRVGAVPGGVGVVSPMALPQTGYRLVSARGNADHNTRWTLRNLPPGTYTWSVQAIDNSFKGSPFAPEASFTIPGQPGQ